MSAAPTTLAAVWRGADGIRIEELPVPAPRPGELVVEIDLATVSGDDRRTASDAHRAPAAVLGHEAVGRVVAAGVGAPAAEGDRVVWAPSVGCGMCDRCRHGRVARCRKLREIGREPIDGPWPLSGAYARHILLPSGSTVERVPDELCDAVAAPAGGATATAMAVREASGDLTGLRVLVCGAGMLGLTATAVARESGASEVVVLDTDASRRSLALAFGATAVVGPRDRPGEADLAWELSGAAEAAPGALAALAIGGRLVLARAAATSAAVPVDLDRVVRRGLAITGVLGSEPRHLREAVAFLASTRTRYPWERLVAPAMGLEHLALLLAQPASVAPRTAIAP
ncbi:MULTISPECIES: alcohol dehydrogenase catalytic domain-containing protein [unclassified Microbacterium]|uniref:alcohol dehydrogenase catalytic domain-containing protein n=1 Tax=Microbacterium TaxID=33882 RepID=UPI003B9ED085